MSIQRLEITADHLKLLQRSCWRWGEVEYGAPEMDGKRPYGNSDVLGDIAKITGVAVPDDPWVDVDEWLDHHPDVCARLRRTHEEMLCVMEIVTSLLTFETGVYARPDGWSPWKRDGWGGEQ